MYIYRHILHGRAECTGHVQKCREASGYSTFTKCTMCEKHEADIVWVLTGQACYARAACYQVLYAVLFGEGSWLTLSVKLYWTAKNWIKKPRCAICMLLLRKEMQACSRGPRSYLYKMHERVCVCVCVSIHVFALSSPHIPKIPKQIASFLISSQ